MLNSSVFAAKTSEYVTLDSVAKDLRYELLCDDMIKYIDPSWKRFGYPHLSGDLRVELDAAICEQTKMHKEDVSRFLKRVQRYSSDVNRDLASERSRNLVNKAETQRNANVYRAASMASQNVQRMVSSTVEAPVVSQQTNAPTVKKARGCGCGRRR